MKAFISSVLVLVVALTTFTSCNKQEIVPKVIEQSTPHIIEGSWSGGAMYTYDASINGYSLDHAYLTSMDVTADSIIFHHHDGNRVSFTYNILANDAVSPAIDTTDTYIIELRNGVNPELVEATWIVRVYEQTGMHYAEWKDRCYPTSDWSVNDRMILSR